MNAALMLDSIPTILGGAVLTLELVVLALAVGLAGAVGLVALQQARRRWIGAPARAYVFAVRGTPLLVQIFLVYYGVSQFAWIREGALWPLLREPFWCAIIALAGNTAAYSAEIMRGALLSVPASQVEAARALGLHGLTIWRRIIAPQALRQALPAYGNEIVLMVKASALASTITMMEMTGIARAIIAQTYAPVEIFIVAGGAYLAINICVGRGIRFLERRLAHF